MKFLISIVGVALILSVNLSAQSKSFSKALKIYEAGEYIDAYDVLLKTYEKVTDKVEQGKIVFLMAECCRKTNNPRKAKNYYAKAIRNKYFEDPIAILYLADMHKMLGEYEDAALQYKAYNELVPNDIRGTHGIESCKLAKEWLEFPNGYEVEEMKFFNSKQLDFSPAFARDDFRVVYLTSTRDESLGKTDHGGTGEEFADIFMSTMDRKGAWSTPVPLSEVINTEFEEGTATFTTDFNTMYFTRCEMNKNKVQGCQIYVTSRKGDEWDKPKVLDIAEDSLVIAHPAITPDELSLYFVSDMDGSIQNIKGENSKDIWVVTRSSISGDWGEPENLGEQINTSGNELYPYVHFDGTLYFSSNGHIGMGGLDIFKAKQVNGRWEIENMAHPINSSSDDFGICFEKDREAGFFSSSRKGRGGDDIYAFLLPPLKFNVTGVVRNKNTDLPIESALVKMVGSDGMTIESTTGEDGMFKFMLQPATDYLFLASKEGEYLQGKERETTKGKEASEDFTTTIYLPPIDKPITVENIIFDFNDTTLRPESTVALDNLVEILNDNANITIELQSHTDNRGDDAYNLRLSDGRARSVVSYLVSNGISSDRVNSKGYGESKPKIVTKKDHENYPFLPEGQELTEAFINTIEDEDLQETAHYHNRRIEFVVLKTDY